jgi:GTP-binding protein HflX
VRLPSGRHILLTDTVGFIRRLPHELIEAFHSTLEEVVLAGFLVHVLDASAARLEEEARITKKILAELGAADKPIITVFNKIDLCPDPAPVYAIARGCPNPVILSAARGTGTEKLLELLAARTE